MAHAVKMLPARFDNAQAEFEHWSRVADFWSNEAFEARRIGAADTAKIFENGAVTARDMANHYRLSVLGGK